MSSKQAICCLPKVVAAAVAAAAVAAALEAAFAVPVAVVLLEVEALIAARAGVAVSAMPTAPDRARADREIRVRVPDRVLDRVPDLGTVREEGTARIDRATGRELATVREGGIIRIDLGTVRIDRETGRESATVRGEGTARVVLGIGRAIGQATDPAIGQGIDREFDRQWPARPTAPCAHPIVRAVRAPRPGG